MWLINTSLPQALQVQAAPLGKKVALGMPWVFSGVIEPDRRDFLQFRGILIQFNFCVLL